MERKESNAIFADCVNLQKYVRFIVNCPGCPPRMVYLPPFLSDLLYLSILMSASPDWLCEPWFPTRKALLHMGNGALVVFIIKGCS